MALECPVFKVPCMVAAVDLSAKQFLCVKPTADFQVNIATAAGENILGVLQDKPLAGSPAEIMGIGITKVYAGVGGLAAGNTWESAADGTGIVAAAAKVGLGMVLGGAAQGQLATVTIGFAQGGTLA